MHGEERAHVRASRLRALGEQVMPRQAFFFLFPPDPGVPGKGTAMNDREGLPQRATDEPGARVYAAIAVVVFAAEATFAAVHVFRGGRYPGFDYWPHDPSVVVVLLVAWSAGSC